jgi:predicted ester cyclase
MTLEENKAVVQRQFDLIQSGDLDALDEVMAPDVANYALGRAQVGLETFKKILRAIHDTFPDEMTTVDDMIAEGDKVVARITLRGTHQGSALPMFAEIKPEGRPVEWQFIHIFRIRDSKIVEHWAQRNDLEVRQQLQSRQGSAA